MFEQVKYDDYDSDEEEDTDIVSRIINAPTRQVAKASVLQSFQRQSCLPNEPTTPIGLPLF